MADTKAAANGTKPTLALREGMKRMGSVSNAPWWIIESGAKLYGVLDGLFERPDERNKVTGKSKFYQITLLEPTKCRYGRDKKAEPKIAPAGTVVNVNYGPKTKDWEPLIDKIIQGASFNVEAICTGDKMDIGGGQTMWPLLCGSEMTKAPMVSDEPDFDGDEGAEQGAAAAG